MGKKKKTPLRTRQVAARLRRMEPVHQVASLEHSVAKGLTEELQKNHGTRNVLGTLNHCRALLAEAVDVQEKAAHTGKVLVLAGNGESKAEELRKALGSALKKEGEVKHDLEGLERQYIAKRFELQSEIQTSIRSQEVRYSTFLF